MNERRQRLLLLGSLSGALLLGLMPSCLERHEERAIDSDVTRCASCHGDPARGGDYLQRSAPPHSLIGTTDVAYPSVGAHQFHVYGSETHGPVACNECHVVPEKVSDPGHADDAEPAEITFGALAQQADRAPTYSSKTRRCSDSYCHGPTSPSWTQPRLSDQACGSCHGLPPEPPHPQSERCSACHTGIDAQSHFPEASLHVNGEVEYLLGQCNACHGGADSPAPPVDTQGNTDPTAPGVGAHATHLAGGNASRPVLCSECHRVPDTSDLSHPNGQSELVFSGVSRASADEPSYDSAARSCTVYCHAPSQSAPHASPAWTDAQALACTACHGAPPPTPHPQISDCNRCHGSVVAADNVTIIDRQLHVNGAVEVDADETCTACHGGANPAPPGDLRGNTATTFPGVGAHQVHLTASSSFRTVECGDCHLEPTAITSPGHTDSPLPAEVVFSGVGAAFDATPTYNGVSCQATPCHGGRFPDGHRSGGTHTEPVWTQVDGSQVVCGGCHSLPPPPPHPYPTDCSQCHKNISSDNQSFIRGDLHVDGQITFELP